MSKSKNDMSVERFEKNLELFAHNNPRAALRLEHLPEEHLSVVPTWANEPNLYHNTQKFFFHSKQNAAWDAKHWFDELFLEGTQALFIFGVGLGYYFNALIDWLKSDPNRMVIFMEDDLNVIKHLLETEQATSLLSHPQVILKYFDTPEEGGWGRFREEFSWFFWTFATIPTAISALKSYAEFRKDFYTKLNYQLQINLSDKKEFLSYFRKESQEEIFTNFYHNLPYTFQSKPAHSFYGRFNQVPAIICGAGPSLSKHFELLKQLQDKAVIFGAGSALNALTAYGVQAHFAAGVDPTPIQENRIRTNQAFTVPFFYRMRFNAGAFQEIQSPKLYVVCGDDPYSTDWFEREWEIFSPQQIEAGTSTTHFCLKVAEALGCNPIIMIGMDLSYKQGKQYSEGIVAHPASGNRERAQITHLKDKVINVKGVAEPLVTTTWSWIQEASLYTLFHMESSDVQLINATEGGMSIWQVPNESLSHVSEKYLTQNFDLSGCIHTIITESGMSDLNQEIILESMDKWLKNLMTCEEKCKLILETLEKSREVILSIQKGSLNQLEGDFQLYQTELEGELVYQEFFHKIDEIFKQIELRDRYLFKVRFEGETALVKKLKKVELDKKQYEYLLMHLQIHRGACQAGMQAFLKYQKSLANRVEQPPPNRDSEESYWIKEGIYHLEDEGLQIYYHQPFSAEKKQVSTDLFKAVSYFQEGKLHGPSYFYDSSGKLISETWYIEGRKEGKSRQYDSSGNLSRQSSFKNGVLEGVQFDFFDNNVVKSQVSYHEGYTEGEALFYFPNGRLRRKVAYKKGKIDGIEQFWDVDGHLIIESDYIQGIPHNISRRWYPNGQLERQVIYGKEGIVIEMNEWDPQGKEK